jgi:predicted HicB family RNase H-like nuclease
MTEIKEQCIYVCGPYKGYCGRAELHLEDDLFHGEVVGVRDVVTFQGKTHGELKQAFRDSVDDYLAFCEAKGESPEKPFSGRFLLRVDPETHRKLATLADLCGKSLNQFVSDYLSTIADSPPKALQPVRSENAIQRERQAT